MKPYLKCCERFLSRRAYPKTPEQLMRSRYTAFAKGGHGQYLLDTWLPTMRNNMTPLQLSQRDTEWIGLKVLEKSQKGDNGLVEFVATYIDEHHQPAIHHEKSVFKRIDGKWLYVGVEASDVKSNTTSINL